MYPDLPKMDSSKVGNSAFVQLPLALIRSRPTASSSMSSNEIANSDDRPSQSFARAKIYSWWRGAISLLHPIGRNIDGFSEEDNISSSITTKHGEAGSPMGSGEYANTL
jgi:hypothetical protein